MNRQAQLAQWVADEAAKVVQAKPAEQYASELFAMAARSISRVRDNRKYCQAIGVQPDRAAEVMAFRAAKLYRNRAVRALKEQRT